MASPRPGSRRSPDRSTRTPPRGGTPTADDDDSPIPSVNERLGHLRPSRELLEYYRKKIAEFDGDHEEMVRKLDLYKATYEEQHKLGWEMRQREDEIAELQKALSDMQVYLFQEREHVLRLYSENDRLKIRELEDRKRIQHLLSLSGPQTGDITYFHREPPAKVTIPQRRPRQQHPHDGDEGVALRPPAYREAADLRRPPNRQGFVMITDTCSMMYLLRLTVVLCLYAASNTVVSVTLPRLLSSGEIYLPVLHATQSRVKNCNTELKDLHVRKVCTLVHSLNKVELAMLQPRKYIHVASSPFLMVFSCPPTSPTAKPRRPADKLTSPETEVYQKDNETLALHVEALQAQLEEQTKLAREQAEALLQDRQVRIEEQDAQRQRDADRIKGLTDRLQKTQDLLFTSTKDFLELKYEGRSDERRWMAEKDRLLRELDMAKDQLNISREKTILEVSEDGGEVTWQAREQHRIEVETLKQSVSQAQRLAEMYREQVIELEDQLSKIREEGDVSKEIFQDRTTKMSKRVQLMNQRYEALERRRAMEVEGFKNDIKMLRGRLKDVEKQLYRVTLGMGEPTPGDEFDMEILHNVRKTAGRSKKIVGEIKHLKAKIYGLENDLRKM
ncbi:coiled-coil domain-containing protein 77-like [Branchiostoma lanceolatum]|uniref:coiled-coil domain-containing protein 77-like n=1 Tax=Branchiostoma lanceolatum TaxID=7740 RepID=UPI003453D0C1